VNTVRVGQRKRLHLSGAERKLPEIDYSVLSELRIHRLLECMIADLVI
jgi:hypothetical protein